MTDIKVHETEDFPPRVSGNYKSLGCEIHSRRSRKTAEIPLQTQDDGSLLSSAHRVRVRFLSLSMLSVLLAFPAQIAASSQADSLKQTKMPVQCDMGRPQTWPGLSDSHVLSLHPPPTPQLPHFPFSSPSPPPLWVPSEPIPQSSLKGPCLDLLCPSSPSPLASFILSLVWTWQFCLTALLSHGQLFPFPFAFVNREEFIDQRFAACSHLKTD